jgi:hypothetical protein
MAFEQINHKYNTEFTNRLLAARHIFYEIYEVCGSRFQYGCGSYLFDGSNYDYCDLMYEKQELLYNQVKTANNVLEIGTYMGHSLLIMLLSNPKLKITCIDISDEYTRPSVNILNKYFNNAIDFIHSDSLTALKTFDKKFDFFHIDGHHDNNYISNEFQIINRLNSRSDKILRVLIDDQVSSLELQANIKSNYKIIQCIVPTCAWNNAYFEIQLFTMPTTFDISTATPLCEIMGRNRSDKGNVDISSSWHNYTTVYYSLFRDMTEKPLRIFELGLGTNNVNLPSNMGAYGRPGASLYGWSEFFINANVFGADIDKDILFQTDRISTFFCDQTNKESIKNMWEMPELNEGFDIIVEDGLHEYNANVCFFENSIHKLNLGGYYIIEDITTEDSFLFINKISEWEVKYPGLDFELINIPSLVNTFDNRLLVIQRGLN